MANCGFSLGSWVINTPSCVLNVLWQIPRARRKPDCPERVASNIGGCTIWWVNYGHLIKLYADDMKGNCEGFGHDNFMVG